MRGAPAIRAQQSFAGMAEISQVPIFSARSMIASLSNPTNGRRTGRETAASALIRFGSVCDATCERLSPVMSASDPNLRATASPQRKANRRNSTAS